MRYLSSFVLCIAGLANAHAQEAVIGNITPKDFIEAKSFRNGERYYVANMQPSGKKDTAVIVLNFYDRSLHPMKKAELEIPVTTRVAGTAFNGDLTMLMLADPARQTRTSMLLDREGHIINSNEETSVKATILTPEYYPLVYAIEPNEFLLIKPAAGKKGYEIEVKDPELNTRWAKSFMPEEGSWSVVDAFVVLDKVFILRKEKKEKYTFSVQCINIAMGKEIYATEIKQGDETGYPSFIRVIEDKAFTAGLYSKDGKGEQDADGIFFAKIDQLGKMEMSVNPWEVMKHQLKGDAASLPPDKSKLFIEDIIEKQSPEGGYTLIGEMINQVMDSKSQNTSFSVGDMMLLQLNREGLLTGADRIEKTKREAVVKGVTTERSPLVAGWLYKKRFFPYSGISEIGGRKFIIYKNEEEGRTKVYFRPIDSVKAETSLDLSMPASGKRTASAAYVFDMSSNTADGSPYRDAMPVDQGQVLLYDMEQSALRMSIQPIPDKK